VTEPLILEVPTPVYWPAHRPLTKQLRHALWIQPLEQDLEAAMVAQLSAEEAAGFSQTIEAVLAEEIAAETQP
jgi:uncharacterized lipoprotein YmbA